MELALCGRGACVQCESGALQHLHGVAAHGVLPLLPPEGREQPPATPLLEQQGKDKRRQPHLLLGVEQR